MITILRWHLLLCALVFTCLSVYALMHDHMIESGTSSFMVGSLVVSFLRSRQDQEER